MRLAVWPVEGARALGRALEAGPVREVVEVPPHGALSALRAGAVDLALVSTLDVLRALGADDGVHGLTLVPGVALAGGPGPTAQLVVRGPLDAVQTVAFSPLGAQDALLAQLVLREHFGNAPQFVPLALDTPAVQAEALAAHDAALFPAEAPVPDGVLVLDLGQEWLDLTLRPMVWGLVVAREGTLGEAEALALRDAARDADARRVDADGDGVAGSGLAFTLDGYGADGLDELRQHLFYHGTLTDLPDLPFLAVADDETPAAHGDGA